MLLVLSLVRQSCMTDQRYTGVNRHLVTPQPRSVTVVQLFLHCPAASITAQCAAGAPNQNLASPGITAIVEIVDEFETGLQATYAVQLAHGLFVDART